MKRIQILPAVLSVLLMSFFSVNLASAACIDLEKSGPAMAAPGETITYHFWVQNCGANHQLTKVFDPLLGDDPNYPIWVGPVESGQVYEFDMSYTLPDPYCGPFTNVARATGYDGSDWSHASDEDTWIVDVVCEPPLCETDLIAGQNWDSPAGVVTVWDDDTNLYVRFETSGGWTLDETHLYVGTEVPTKSSPGKFPFSSQTTYTIPLSDLGVVCGDDLYIAAHAVVSKDGQQETAWADSYGTQFGNSWALYFGYEVCGECFQP